MSNGWRPVLLAMIAASGLTGPTAARADIVVNGGFGPNGDLGFVNSPTNLSVTFGATGQGSLYQMDGFVNVPGHDFGSGAGVSAELTNGAPTGLAYTFGAYQPSAGQLLISYQFANNTGAALPGFQFLYFVDPDIGPNFADESARTTGLSKLGFPNPSSYQVGDPALSSIFSNALSGTLSNVNEQPAATPGDVSIALGFSSGTLGIGQTASYQVLLSDNGSQIGDVAITQQDPVFTTDSLTVSGQVVPEPSAMVSMAVGGVLLLGLALRRRVLGQRLSGNEMA